VTEFAGNGSLARHLPMPNHSEQCGLHKPNRIARIIVGMDFDWNLRIADFRHNILRGALEPPTLIDPEKALISSSVD
jgi:hypothetical protein